MKTAIDAVCDAHHESITAIHSLCNEVLGEMKKKNYRVKMDY